MVSCNICFRSVLDVVHTYHEISDFPDFLTIETSNGEKFALNSLAKVLECSHYFHAICLVDLVNDLIESNPKKSGKKFLYFNCPRPDCATRISTWKDVMSNDPGQLRVRGGDIINVKPHVADTIDSDTKLGMETIVKLSKCDESALYECKLENLKMTIIKPAQEKKPEYDSIIKWLNSAKEEEEPTCSKYIDFNAPATEIEKNREKFWHLWYEGRADSDADSSETPSKNELLQTCQVIMDRNRIEANVEKDIYDICPPLWQPWIDNTCKLFRTFNYYCYSPWIS